MQQISEMQKLMSHKFRRHTLLTFTKSYTAKTFQDMTADEFSGYHCSKVLHSSVSSIDHDPCCFHRIFFLQTEIIVFILHCIYACVSWMICIPYNRISHWNEHFFFCYKMHQYGCWILDLQRGSRWGLFADLFSAVTGPAKSLSQHGSLPNPAQKALKLSSHITLKYTARCLLTKFMRQKKSSFNCRCHFLLSFLAN